MIAKQTTLALCAVTTAILSACSASGIADGRSATANRRSERPAVCPRSRPARSTGDVPQSLAPGVPKWTTTCVYDRSRLRSQKAYRRGPLDNALNSSVSKLPPRQGCGSVARLPMLVLLTYTETVRRVVLDMNGCPTVILRSGTQRPLRDRAASLVIRYYERAAPR
jgi:hypothetical protein